MSRANTKGSDPGFRGAAFASIVSFISFISFARPDDVTGTQGRSAHAIEGEAVATVVSFVLWGLNGPAYLSDLIAAYCL